MGLYLGQQKIANLGETFTPREIQSVNGKTSVQGNITLYGNDISVSNNDSRNLSVALAELSSAIPTKVSELQNDVGYLSSVPDLDASKITSGTFDSARLPLATSSTKGAVQPVSKTNEMTADVGVDANGKLYVAAPDMSNYWTKAQTSSNVEISSAFDTQNLIIASEVQARSAADDALSNAISTVTDSLSSYYQKSETSSANEISIALSAEHEYVVQNMARITMTDWSD